jgi:hypothetical protein
MTRTEQKLRVPLESITKEMVDSKYRYDSITGAFSVANPHPYMPRRNPGTVSNRGYLMLNLCGRQCSAHRLAFLIMTGRWPENHVDHIDGNRLNNAWANLRDVKRQTNNENVRKARKDSHTGYLGARKRPNGTFYAAITVNRKGIWLGTFKTVEEAHHVYLEAKRQYHKGCTI